MTPPPLSLYVHLPWCLSKCPYCDFNSHAVESQSVPRGEYVDALLKDLEGELPLVWGRVVQSIFLGGGTPSLFSAGDIARLLDGIRSLLTLAPDTEVTMEANPGATEHGRFGAYLDAGVNRVSLGVQSFDDALLQRIGRIHGRAETEAAVLSLQQAGLENYNLDLMFALPGQTPEQAVDDVVRALDCGPAHVSHYQLTIEPNTAFGAAPPRLPEEDEAWEMQQRCAGLLDGAGFRNYEISAHAKPGSDCRHNLNYWTYGDFLGIGAGAHGKVTLAATGVIRRRIRLRHPRSWMAAVQNGEALAEDREIGSSERIFEFFLNQLRLRRGVSKTQFVERTGLPWNTVEDRVRMAVERELLTDTGEWLIPTELGWRFGNETQAIFLP